MGHQKEEGKNKNRATSKNPFVYSTRSNEEGEGWEAVCFRKWSKLDIGLIKHQA